MTKTRDRQRKSTTKVLSTLTANSLKPRDESGDSGNLSLMKNGEIFWLEIFLKKTLKVVWNSKLWVRFSRVDFDARVDN